MKSFLVVYGGKSYVVKGKFIEYGSNGIVIVGEDRSTVLVVPNGTMVVDMACLDEDETVKRGPSFSIA